MCWNENWSRSICLEANNLFLPFISITTSFYSVSQMSAQVVINYKPLTFWLSQIHEKLQKQNIEGRLGVWKKISFQVHLTQETLRCVRAGTKPIVQSWTDTKNIVQCAKMRRWRTHLLYLRDQHDKANYTGSSVLQNEPRVRRENTAPRKQFEGIARPFHRSISFT